MHHKDAVGIVVEAQDVACEHVLEHGKEQHDSNDKQHNLAIGAKVVPDVVTCRGEVLDDLVPRYVP